jgi:hypothetical protein
MVAKGSVARGILLQQLQRKRSRNILFFIERLYVGMKRDDV